MSQATLKTWLLTARPLEVRAPVATNFHTPYAHTVRRNQCLILRMEVDAKL
jgi:hypothetical protein